MFGWIGKRFTKGALKQVRSDVKDHAIEISGKILDLVKAPPEKALAFWSGLSEEDKELFKDAAVSAARLAARAVIAADKGGKVSF